MKISTFISLILFIIILISCTDKDYHKTRHKDLSYYSYYEYITDTSAYDDVRLCLYYSSRASNLSFIRAEAEIRAEFSINQDSSIFKKINCFYMASKY